MVEKAHTESILKAINEVMAEVGNVKKTGKNKFQGYDYASEADVLNAIRPEMVKAGLLLLPSVVNEPRIVEATTDKGKTNFMAYVSIEYTLAHISGEVWPEKFRTEGCGMDTQDKAVSKAMTSAQKYFLLKFFLMPTGDDPDKGMEDDGVKHTKRVVSSRSREEVEQISSVALEVGMRKAHAEGFLPDWWLQNNQRIKELPSDDRAILEKLKDELKAKEKETT